MLEGFRDARHPLLGEFSEVLGYVFSIIYLKDIHPLGIYGVVDELDRSLAIGRVGERL